MGLSLDLGSDQDGIWIPANFQSGDFNFRVFNPYPKKRDVS